MSSVYQPGSAARERALDALLSKQAIYELLCRYCRGIDRCDPAVLKSAYWPDATETHGTFNGNAWEFADYMTDNMRTNMQRSHQQIGNALIEIEVDGIHARGETYVTGFMHIDGPDGMIDMVVGGRYLDRYERRGDEWRILDRVYVLDWNQNLPSTAQWNEGLFKLLQTRGARAPEDPWNLGLPARRTTVV